MARFDYVAEHLPGKLLYTAVAIPGPSDHIEDDRMETLVEAITSSVLVQDSKLDSLTQHSLRIWLCVMSY